MMNDDTQYLIVWTDSDDNDHYHYEEGIENARKYYNELPDGVFPCSIVAIVESDIYCTHPNLKNI